MRPLTGWANGPERLLSEANPLRGMFAIGAIAGLTSLVSYGESGYSRSMLLLWLTGLVALSFSFWSVSRALPRIALGDVLAPGGRRQATQSGRPEGTSPDLWQQVAQSLTQRYPQGRIRNVTGDGTRVVLEVPAETS